MKASAQDERNNPGKKPAEKGVGGNLSQCQEVGGWEEDRDTDEGKEKPPWQLEPAFREGPQAYPKGKAAFQDSGLS